MLKINTELIKYENANVTTLSMTLPNFEKFKKDGGFQDFFKKLFF